MNPEDLAFAIAKFLDVGYDEHREQFVYASETGGSVYVASTDPLTAQSRVYIVSITEVEEGEA